MTPNGYIALGLILQIVVSTLTLLKVAYMAGQLKQQIEVNESEINKLREWRESITEVTISAKAHSAH